MQLSLASEGETVRVSQINAGLGLQRRLADMGLTRGVEIVITNKQHPGPIVLDLRGSRLALGHGVAHKIMVEQVLT